MVAHIFIPARNAMQSGTAKTKSWLLVYEPETPRVIEPLMGWTSSGDTKQQLRMSFDSQAEAVAFCERHGIAFRVSEPKMPRRRTVVYSDNFAFGRRSPWTH